MSEPYHFSSTITVTLANGDVQQRRLNDHILAYSPVEAWAGVETVIRDIVNDWGCDKLDAPVEAIEIHRVTWTGWPQGEESPKDILNDDPTPCAP